MHMHNAAMTFRCASAFVQMSVQSFRVSCLQSGASSPAPHSCHK